MSLSEPEEGATATAQLAVGINDLANALPLADTDAFPAVFATARLVALMEIASARVLIPLLGAGQLSVGVSLDATHTAPTPLGAHARKSPAFEDLLSQLSKGAARFFLGDHSIPGRIEDRSFIDPEGGHLGKGSSLRLGTGCPFSSKRGSS
jgi:hypothetical protein